MRRDTSMFDLLESGLERLDWRFGSDPNGNPPVFGWLVSMRDTSLWNDIQCELLVHATWIEVVGWLPWRKDFTAPQDRLPVFATINQYYTNTMGAKVRIGVSDQGGEGPMMIRFGMSFEANFVRRAIENLDESHIFQDIINVPMIEMSWWTPLLHCLREGAPPPSHEQFARVLGDRGAPPMWYLLLLFKWRGDPSQLREPEIRNS